jgi:hypothetical protein
MWASRGRVLFEIREEMLVGRLFNYFANINSSVRQLKEYLFKAQIFLLILMKRQNLVGFLHPNFLRVNSEAKFCCSKGYSDKE